MFTISRMSPLMKHQAYVHVYLCCNENFTQIDLYVHLCLVKSFKRTLFSLSNIFCKPNVKSLRF